MKQHTVLKTAFVILSLLILAACGGSGGSTSSTESATAVATKKYGSATFNLSWEQPAKFAGKILNAATTDACSDYGVSLISVKFIDGTGAVSAQSSWPCANHTGTVEGIPAQSGYSVLIECLMADNSLAWSAKKTDVTIAADTITSVGTFNMVYVGSDTATPTVVSVTPAGNSTNVPVTSPILIAFSSKMAASSINTSNITVSSGGLAVSGAISYDSASKTARFQPSANLAYNSTYTITVSKDVTNMADKGLGAVFTSTFNTESQALVAPAAPTGVFAMPAIGQNTITWNAVNGATSYNLYWSTSPGVTTASGTKVSNLKTIYTHTSLTNGTTIYYVVTAVNGVGESAASTTASARPDVPLNLSAKLDVLASPGEASNTITWKAATGAVGYNIYWSTSNTVSKSTGTKITSVTTPYTQRGLTNGTPYYYVVTAYNATGGESVDSDVVSATPSGANALQAPTGLVATVAGTTITLSWNPVAGATSYNVYWGTSPGVTTSSTKIAGVTNAIYHHSGLTPDNKYYYIVTANFVAGEGPASPGANGTILPGGISSFREVEPNDVKANATVMVIGEATVEMRGQMSSNFDLDEFKFTSTGGTVSFVIKPDPDITEVGGIRATVVDDLGNIISANDIGSTGSVTLSARTAPGDYYLIISITSRKDLPETTPAFRKDYIITSSYVSMTREAEPNNDISIATPITIGSGEVRGQLHNYVINSHLDKDYYTFTGTGGDVTFTIKPDPAVTGAAGAINVTILAGDGVTVLGSNNLDVATNSMSLTVNTKVGYIYFLKMGETVKPDGRLDVFLQDYIITSSYTK